MKIAVRIAQAGNQILNIIVMGIILFLFLYGGYSLWDTYMSAKSAFLSDDLLSYKPQPGEGANPSLEDLMAINKDVAGWITIDDTHIDYPVVQGKDDMEYINKDVYGEFSLSGSIFLSCMNKKDFSDNYNLVYGHHMANGGMFGDVVSFTEKSYFDKHKTGELYLPDKTMHIDLFACMKTSASDSKVYNPQNISKTSESFKSFLDYVREAAICYRDSGRQDTGQIIGLSTCSEAVTNGRVILFGRLSEKQSKAKESRVREVLSGQMKRSKIKGKWIWGVLSTTLAIIFLFSVKMIAVYAAEGERECTIVIPVSVEKSEFFEYALEPADENSSTEAVFSEVEVTQEGITKGSFEEMRYTRPGDYKYTVYQLKGESKDVIYDGSVYEVTVRVVNTQEGGLAAEVWAVKDQSDQKTDEIKFINQYKETTTATTEAINNTIHHTITNTITKSSIGTSSPKTGDKSNVMLWGGIAILSGLCVFFFIFEGKRRKTEE